MKVELIDITYEGLDRVVAEHKGKVVIIDVWATWCGPCVKEFPHFVELHEKYKDRGLVCIAVSTDETDTKDKALEFLIEQKAKFRNYRLSEERENAAKELREKYPTNSQPVKFVFDRSGRKVKEIGTRMKAEEVDAYVSKQLESN